MTKTYWLSFCDGDRPKGQQFLGVAVVDVCEDDCFAIEDELEAKFPNRMDGSEWVAAASRKAWTLGCNPGGEMMSFEVPGDEMWRFDGFPRGVLLSKPQLEELGHPVVAAP